MNLNTSKKRAVAVAAAVALAVGGSGIAYAYWTAGGSGTGTAATANGQSALTVNQTAVLTGMYPGDTAQTLSGTFTNPNAGAIYVGTVTASISSVTPVGTCGAADYTLAGAAMTVNANVPAGVGVGAWTGATIKFNDDGTNQDDCKGATVNLAYTIS